MPIVQRNPDTGEEQVFFQGRWQTIKAPVGTGLDTGAQGPAGEVGGGEAFLIGAGETFQNTLDGARNLFFAATNNLEAQGQLAAKNAEQARLVDPLREAQGFAVGAGNIAPFLATAPLGGASALGQGTLGAGIGVSQFREDVSTQFGFGAAEGALGAIAPALGKVAEGVIRTIRGGARATVAGIRGRAAAGPLADDVTNLAEQGFQFTPGQLLEFDPLKQAEAAFSSRSLSSTPFKLQQRSNQKLLNRKVMAAFGRDGDTLPAEILGEIADDAGNAIAGVAKQVDSIDVSAALPRLEAIENSVTVGFVRQPATARIIQNITRAADDGKLTGAQYVNGRSELVKEIQRLSKAGKGAEAEKLFDVVTILDDAFEASAPANVVQAYREARQSWRMLQAVQSAVNDAGDVSIGKLQGNLKRTFPRESGRGGGLLPEGRTATSLDVAQDELLTTAKILNKPNFKAIVGDSGTATRSQVASLTDLAAGVGSFAALKASNTAAGRSALLSGGLGQQLDPITQALLTQAISGSTRGGLDTF